ncbi:unnamed protein product [Brugia pahangi]|uniref:DUF4753 domain-containing protein n=1 Tax=Brugia pahangi TaxID=6280 RepID=A0A0N4TGK1_BRUPA|nr:unnamed protein product [Brugia pahangi]
MVQHGVQYRSLVHNVHHQAFFIITNVVVLLTKNAASIYRHGLLSFWQ